MIKDDGIRALIPGVVLDSEEKEIRDAREYIRRKLGVRNELHAAPTTLTSDYLHPAVSIKLPDEQKDEFGYTPSQNKEIEKVITRPSAPKGLWKNYVKASNETNNKDEALAKALIENNKLAESESPKQTWERLDKNEKIRQKKHLKDLILFGLENSSEPVIKNPVMRKALEPKLPPKSVNYLSNNYSFAENFKKQSKNINDFSQKNDLKSEVIIDPKHPDGFRLAEDNDLYKNYSDTPVRYVQEMKYKYKDGGVPTDSVVKTFDSADRSSYPSDPVQKKALAKYQLMYDKLSPLQKKQLETTQKLKKK